MLNHSAWKRGGYLGLAAKGCGESCGGDIAESGGVHGDAILTIEGGHSVIAGWWHSSILWAMLTHNGIIAMV